MAQHVFNNFSQGIQASPGYIANAQQAGASDIRNLIVDENGDLIRRGGQVNQGNAFGATPTSLMWASYRPDTGVSRTFVFAVFNNSLYYLFSDASWHGVATPITMTSSDYSFTVAGGRLFMANGAQPFWVDISGAVPVVHWWGINPNTKSGYSPTNMNDIAWTASLAGLSAGKLNSNKYYGYSFAYYNAAWGIESKLAPRKTVFCSDPGTANQCEVDLASLDVNSDPQATHKRIYRTIAQDSVAEAASLSTPLYFVDQILNSAVDYSDNAVADADIGAANDSGWHENPPINIRYLTHYANRIWGATDTKNALFWTKVDGDGAPVFDAMPRDGYVDDSGLRAFSGTAILGGSTNPTTSTSDYNKVSHVINIGDRDGDPITGLVPAPATAETGSSANGLTVLKANSVTQVRGSGDMPGLYVTPFDAAARSSSRSGLDLDASAVNSAIGSRSPRTVVTGGGKFTTFFGSDRQVWAIAGMEAQPLSLPIQPFLDSIPEARLGQLVAYMYKNRYEISFPAGDTENDLLAVFDFTKKYWTLHDIGIKDAIWARSAAAEIVSGSGTADALYVIRSLPAGVTKYVQTMYDGTTDAGTAFAALWQSNWIDMKANSLVTGIYVYLSTADISVTVRVDTDGVNGTAAAFTPAVGNRHRFGVFARGRRFRVNIQGLALDKIERIVIEYQQTGE
jgi:hypothetical protein